VFGKGDGALIGLFLSGYETEQGSFTVTVPAHQADPFARIDPETGLGKEDLLAIGF
jgi:hypothetical protein